MSVTILRIVNSRRLLLSTSKSSSYPLSFLMNPLPHPHGFCEAEAVYKQRLEEMGSLEVLGWAGLGCQPSQP